MQDQSDIFSISGIKGMGKTTFLNYLSDNFSNDKNWVVLQPRDKINVQDFIRLLFNERRFNSFLQHVDNLNIENVLLKKGSPDPGSFDEEYFDSLVKILSAIRTYKVKILLLLDDVNYSDENVLIKYIRKIPMRMVKTICAVDTIDFLKIKEKNINLGENIQLQPLNDNDVMTIFDKELKVGNGNANILTMAVQGYPLAFQAIGQIISDNKNIKGWEILEKLDAILEENCFRSLRKRLSANEKKILRCYKDCSSDGIKAVQIRNEIGMSRFSFTKYRSILINKGLIEDTGFGYTRTVIPRIAEVL